MSTNPGFYHQIGSGLSKALGKKNTAAVEHPCLSHLNLAYATRPQGTDELACLHYYIAVAARSLLSGLRGGLPVALPPGVAELFAYRLSLVIGVRVPVITLHSRKPRNSAHYIKKVPGGWVASERIPKSLPLYYILPLTGEETFFHYGLREKFKKQILKECPIDRSAYADFPSNPSLELINATRWDSTQRMQQYAFRALLYATFPHTSNSLIDTFGNLWLIDHATIPYTADKKDIEELGFLVKNSEPVMEACRQVSRITEDDIRSALSGIDERYWQGGVFDNELDAAEYFINRLRVWKSKFK